jgi:hypothetical protein
MACHIKQNIKPFEYVIPIQVGAKNAPEIFLEQRDDQGENISGKNHIYSELTAFFWMWKNCSSDYLGICHYRRFFNIDEKKILEIMKQGKVIVPTKALLGRNIEMQYKYNHGSEIWDTMIDVLKEKDFEMYDFSKRIFSDNPIFPFNMMIASKEYIAMYSEWLFDILFEVENRITDIELDSYQLRYTGFLAERLFTLYIRYHQVSIYECDLIDELGNNISPSILRKVRNNVYYKIFGG